MDRKHNQIGKSYLIWFEVFYMLFVHLALITKWFSENLLITIS